MISKNIKFLLPILFFIHFVGLYPGAMTSDSQDQFLQSLIFNINSHHPPLTAILWSYLNYLYPGPQTILLLNISLLWLGISFLYFANRDNQYRFLYLIIPFLPSVLGQSGYIWKDVSFAFCYFFCFGVCVYYLYRKQRAPAYIILAVLVALFYGTSVKFQGKFILSIMLFFMFHSMIKVRFIVNLVSTVIFSFGIIFLNTIITDKFSVNTQSWQLREIFDIAAIVKEIGDDSALPSYVRESPKYNFETLKKKFTHEWVDPLIFPEDKIYESTQDRSKLDDLNSSFLFLVKNHPVVYLKHRMLNLLRLLGKAQSNKLTKPTTLEELQEKIQHERLTSLNPDIFYIQNNYIYRFLDKILVNVPKLFSFNFISLLIVLIYAFYLAKYKIQDTESEIMLFVASNSIVFTLVLLFATMASDYRYYYIVRLFSLFSLPIFLKFCNNLHEKRILIKK